MLGGEQNRMGRARAVDERCDIERGGRPHAFLALGVAAAVMFAGIWLWQGVQPILGLGPLAAAQLIVMIGVLDPVLPRAHVGVVTALKSIAWFGFWLGLGFWTIWAAAWLYAMANA
jgi:hypothetical protein